MNWWKAKRPGYDPANQENVEWTGWNPDTAVKICWRNWGRQIRVLPQPNLAATRFPEASREPLRRLAGVIKGWASRLPKEKRFLYPGIKVGWEASVGINAYHYPNGNGFLDADPARDPITGLDMKRDFAGGLAPLGYAALSQQISRQSRTDAITLADHEKITADYLAFLAGVCRHEAGLRRDEIFTHAGGQFAPWPRHYTHRVAVNADSTPGWSLYGHSPEEAGDLAAVLKQSRRDEWCAAEWLPTARIAEQWAEAFRRTFTFRQCRFVAVYNWEGVRRKPEAIAGLQAVLGAKK